MRKYPSLGGGCRPVRCELGAAGACLRGAPFLAQPLLAVWSESRSPHLGVCLWTTQIIILPELKSGSCLSPWSSSLLRWRAPKHPGPRGLRPGAQDRGHRRAWLHWGPGTIVSPPCLKGQKGAVVRVARASADTPILFLPESKTGK